MPIKSDTPQRQAVMDAIRMLAQTLGQPSLADWQSQVAGTGKRPMVPLAARQLLAKAVSGLGGAVMDPANEALGLMAPLEAGAKAAASIRAYHGSPHDFDKFSVEKVGTGEGAQAYGHGLYFAEKEGTAKEYRKALADFEVHEPSGSVVGGGKQRSFQGSPADRALAWVQDAASRPDVADPFASAERWARGGIDDSDPMKAAIVQQIRDWRANGATVKPGGRMYEVNIKADPDTLLDWDKPLSQQPVKERVLAALDSPDWVKAQLADRPGSIAYQAAGGNASGSVRLREGGIPGIKYLDQGSRAASEGTRNYVLFDDSIIEILRKYGLLPPAVAGGYASQQGAGR